MIIAGFAQRHSADTASNPAALWQEFAPFAGKVPGQVGGDRYGLMGEPDSQGAFDYIAGVEVETQAGLNEQLHWFELAPVTYAVFEYQGHLSGVAQTVEALREQWLAESGYTAARAPVLERYSGDYDALAATGTVEIWFPVMPKAI